MKCQSAAHSHVLSKLVCLMQDVLCLLVVWNATSVEYPPQVLSFPKACGLHLRDKK